ncbi:MAG: hypothetical protein P8M17_13830, partial [Saprospiraceae bacterium]|nr:hypothetical protein [Saprospiraceae bacterium]
SNNNAIARGILFKSSITNIISDGIFKFYFRSTVCNVPIVLEFFTRCYVKMGVDPTVKEGFGTITKLRITKSEKIMMRCIF